MNFEIDKQTISDLNLFSKESKSIFTLFNHVKTFGGRLRLLDMMELPSTEKHFLERRIESIQFFNKHTVELSLTNQQIDFIQHYLKSSRILLKTNVLDVSYQKIKNQIKNDPEYYIIQTGIKHIIYTIKTLSRFVEDCNNQNFPPYLKELVEQILYFNDIKEIQKILATIDLSKRETEIVLTAAQIHEYDNLFRKKLKDQIYVLLDIIFEIDVLISVAKASKKYNLAFPVFREKEEISLKIDGLFHPLLEQPVKNDVAICEKKLCFLTGPNMAGKSTLLKSMGIALYLAHIGFPVPATYFESTLFNGIVTTINLSDNINVGFSHFYSEVRRVKDVALKIRDKKKLFIIFDELFRGTNVKDAFDGSLILINAFSEIDSSLFFISTHIVELAHELKHSDNILFKQLESSIEGLEPKFTYKLIDGISEDRLGLIIIKKEGIIEILKSV